MSLLSCEEHLVQCWMTHAVMKQLLVRVSQPADLQSILLESLIFCCTKGKWACRLPDGSSRRAHRVGLNRTHRSKTILCSHMKPFSTFKLFLLVLQVALPPRGQNSASRPPYRSCRRSQSLRPKAASLQLWQAGKTAKQR